MNVLTLITPPDIQLRLPSQPVRVIGIDLGTTKLYGYQPNPF